MSESHYCRIAIIGMGPRGLGAVEALAERMNDAGTTLRIDVFDPTAAPGAGPNFSPRQNPLCLLNVPNREIAIAAPSYPGARLPAFADWLQEPACDPERFPARAELGGYFMTRLQQISERAPATLRLTLRAEAVEELERTRHGWWLIANGERRGPFDEVLMTPGQPRTKPDTQLARWQDHAESNGLDLLPAYPDHALLRAAQGWAGKPVAIRGLGLSTLDVLRLLTCGCGGRFEGGRYVASGREPARILPFSLDGHAPVPKPASAEIDQLFDPLTQETEAFASALADAIRQEPDEALQTICDAIRTPVTRILCHRGVSDDVVAWLETERDNPGAQESRSAVAALRAGIAMAHGEQPPSAGFAVGQVWRKWQDTLRRGFNPGSAAPETASALVRFDERLKRFSYGPPVRSAEELLMLIEAEIVDLRAVEDPDIALTPTGWRLVEDDTSAEVVAMVDAVLPSPDLGAVTDPLIAGLRDAGTLCPVVDGLGARLTPDAQVVGRDGTPAPSLSLLGRMALGSVIAVDSIHDCFGAAADRWADGVLARARAKAPA
ncbi:FAD/NAD(P)-binding protein [Halovulum sp. GXIMD14794]